MGLRGTRAGRACAVALPAAVALCALAGSAAAREAPRHQTTTRIEIEGSHGYSVDLVVLDGRRAFLSADRGPFFAGYEVPARGFPGIEARFGSLGEIDVDFHVTNTSVEDFSGCVYRIGVFTGTLRFRGERGYTSFDLSEAPGRIEQVPRGRSCLLVPEDGSAWTSASSDQSRSVVARRTQGARVLAFSAFRDGTVAQQPQFFGELRERRGPMTILRSTSATGRPASFRVLSLRPSRVLVARPPWPFSGSAVFRRRAGSRPTWHGSLRVPLLGAGSFRMAGPGFTAGTCVKRTSLPGCLYHSIGMPELGR